MSNVAIFNNKGILINATSSYESGERKSIYQAVRFAWRMNKEKAQEYPLVFVMVHHKIREVFLVDEWLDATVENFPEFAHEFEQDKDNKLANRIGFRGELAYTIRLDYIGKEVPKEYWVQAPCQYIDNEIDIAQLLSREDKLPDYFDETSGDESNPNRAIKAKFANVIIDYVKHFKANAEQGLYDEGRISEDKEWNDFLVEQGWLLKWLDEGLICQESYDEVLENRSEGKYYLRSRKDIGLKLIEYMKSPLACSRLINHYVLSRLNFKASYRNPDIASVLYQISQANHGIIPIDSDRFQELCKQWYDDYFQFMRDTDCHDDKAKSDALKRLPSAIVAWYGITEYDWQKSFNDPMIEFKDILTHRVENYDDWEEEYLND